MHKQTLQPWIEKGVSVGFLSNAQRSPEKRKKRAYASFVFILSLCFVSVSGQNAGLTSNAVFGQNNAKTSESRNAKFARAEITPSVGLRVVSSSLMTVQDEGADKNGNKSADVLKLDTVQSGSTTLTPILSPRPKSPQKETQEPLKNESNEKLKRQIVKLAVELENMKVSEQNVPAKDDSANVKIQNKKEATEEISTPTTTSEPQDESKEIAETPSEEKERAKTNELPQRLAVVEQEDEDASPEEIQTSEAGEEESANQEESEDVEELEEEGSELETAPLPFMSANYNDEEEEEDEEEAADDFDESTAGFATSAGVAVSSSQAPNPSSFQTTPTLGAYPWGMQSAPVVYQNVDQRNWQTQTAFAPQQAVTTSGLPAPMLPQPVAPTQVPPYAQQAPQTAIPTAQMVAMRPTSATSPTYVQSSPQLPYSVGRPANASVPQPTASGVQYAPNAPVRQSVAPTQASLAVSNGVQPSQYARQQVDPEINAEKRRVNNSFYAKETNYLGAKEGGKVFRSFDESSLQPSGNGKTRTTGTLNLNAPNRSTSPFTSKIAPMSALEPSVPAHNPIVQVSATIPAVANDDEFMDEDALPEAPSKGTRRTPTSGNVVQPQKTSIAPSNWEESNSAASETSSESARQNYVEERPVQNAPVESNVAQKVAREQTTSSVVVISSDDDEFVMEEGRETNVFFEDESESGRLFPNLRPFKRARQRLLAGRFGDAPNPPNVEEIELIQDSAVPIAKEPLLTKENPNLPPLAVRVDGKYGDEVVDDVVTRSDLNALREEAKGFAWTKGDLKIVPYGFLNLSVSSDTQRGVPGEYMLYAQSPDVDDSSDFAVDARTSRLGLKISGPRIERLNSVLGGCVEFDFQGYPNGSKNKGGVQLRRAYAELVDEQNDRKFLAGQDWEIISPATPQMLNYLPAGFAGDMQYRRGQLRFEQGWKVSSDLRFLGQIAVCDDVISDYSSTAGVTPSSAGWPILEMRLATNLFQEELNGRPIVMGVSGHIGEQYYKFSPIAGTFASTSERTAIKTWSTNFDFEVPIAEKHKIQGEYFIGSNLSTFCGGINQGVDLYRRDGIGDAGGWIALHSDWTKKFATNVGYGLDKPDREDLVGTSMASNGFATSRTRNEVYFLNFIYNWTPNFMTGLENSYWKTDYQKADVTGATPVFYSMKSGESVRTEFVTRLSF